MAISDQIAPGVGPDRPLDGQEPLEDVAAVILEEGLHQIAVADDRAGHQHHLGRVAQVPQRDQLLQAVQIAQRNGQRQHHGKARENRPGHEVGRKNRAVPAGNDRHGKIQTDDRVDRQHQRRAQAGQQQIGRLVVLPVPGRTAPAQRQHAKKQPGPMVLGLVAQRRHVGNQAGIPEQERDRGIGRDREHVPQQRTAELRPEGHRVGIGEQPIKQPRPAQMQQRKQAGAGHREQRHRLGKAVDARPPLLPEQQQEGRDERAGVTDADPPDEIDDRKCPGHGNVGAPNADAGRHQVIDRHQQHAQKQRRRAETRPPEPGRVASSARCRRSCRSPSRRCAGRSAPATRSSGVGVSTSWP